MKRLRAAIFIMFFSLTYFANMSFMSDRGKGVHFMEWKWSDVEEQAKLRDLPIFVYMKTSYCSEAPRMDVVFKHKEVGEVLNYNFLCNKMTTETVVNNIHATNWGVVSVPSYLFFTPGGKLLYKCDGHKSVQEMLGEIQTAREKLVEYQGCKEDKMCDKCKDCR